VHPDVASTLGLIAQQWSYLNEPQKALKLLERALGRENKYS
jgi:hypothetical protein